MYPTTRKTTFSTTSPEFNHPILGTHPAFTRQATSCRFLLRYKTATYSLNYYIGLKRKYEVPFNNLLYPQIPQTAASLLAVKKGTIDRHARLTQGPTYAIKKTQFHFTTQPPAVTCLDFCNAPPARACL